jgi:two-component system, LytTR family, sensor kinase
MLLLPYIENAFKYGISYTADSFIDISISVNNEELNCNVTNTDHAAARKGRPSAGMGMADTLKRLQLQYEGKFTLECAAADGLFIVGLHLELR